MIKPIAIICTTFFVSVVGHMGLAWGQEVTRFIPGDFPPPKVSQEKGKHSTTVGNNQEKQQKSKKVQPLSMQELQVHGPLIFSRAPQNPSDQYPMDLIYDVMNPKYGSYRVCDKQSCQRIRNFGHDDNYRGAYEEFILHQQRMRR